MYAVLVTRTVDASVRLYGPFDTRTLAEEWVNRQRRDDTDTEGYEWEYLALPIYSTDVVIMRRQIAESMAHGRGEHAGT